MNNDINNLYQELIIDHNNHPRNVGKIEHCSHHAHGDNPICGDEVTIYLHVDNNIIDDIKFTGKGCAISVASASLLTELIKSKTVMEAKHLFENFHNMLTLDTEHVNKQSLGKCIVLENVKQFPMRVKCATLAWHTMLAALEQNSNLISTEA